MRVVTSIKLKAQGKITRKIEFFWTENNNLRKCIALIFKYMYGRRCTKNRDQFYELKSAPKHKNSHVIGVAMPSPVETSIDGNFVYNFVISE